MVLKETDKNTRWMIVIAGLFLLLALVFVMFSWRQMRIDGIETAVVDPACDLHLQACEAQFENNKKIIFSISPKPIKPLVPLALQVEVNNIIVDSVQVDFQGIGVDIGFYRPELTKDDNGYFTGFATLSVCTLEKMLWQSTVIIKTAEGTIIAPFRFEVEQS